MGIRAYASLGARWARILLGRSYYHVPQPLGRRFSGDRVSGYYNDLTGKANWVGDEDADRVPLVRLSNGRRAYHPIAIAQMALGNYDLWLETGATRHKRRFVQLAAWLRDNQDGRGGFVNPWSDLRPSCVSDYSAMAQGEAISVLVRAHALTKQRPYLDRAQRAFDILIQPVERGGCAYWLDEDLYLEEYPEAPRSTVLNGWIFGIFGVFDLALATGDQTVGDVLARTLNTSEKNLETYDCGYWSYYDVQRNIASPFYHSLHIALLDALYAITAREHFKAISRAWTEYRASAINKQRALAVKIWQKVRRPPAVTVEP